jgi:enoyl-CoA hydratase/carnithine racemase
MGATHFLPRLVGDELAARLLLTGELFTGARAKEMRLVHEVCESESEVLPLAKKIAHQIATCSTPVIRTSLAYGLSVGRPSGVRASCSIVRPHVLMLPEAIDGTNA